MFPLTPLTKLPPSYLGQILTEAKSLIPNGMVPEVVLVDHPNGFVALNMRTDRFSCAYFLEGFFDPVKPFSVFGEVS